MNVGIASVLVIETEGDDDEEKPLMLWLGSMEGTVAVLDARVHCLSMALFTVRSLCCTKSTQLFRLANSSLLYQHIKAR